MTMLEPSAQFGAEPQPFYSEQPAGIGTSNIPPEEVSLGMASDISAPEIRAPEAITLTQEQHRTVPEGRQIQENAIDYSAFNVNKGEMISGIIEQVQGTDKKEDTKDSTDTFTEIASGVGSVANDILATIAEGEAADYQQDMQYWMKNKPYFDVYSDIEPDLDAYLESMPSATDALYNSSIPGMIDDAADVGVSEDAEAFWYVFHKGGEGAISGSSGGWVGTIVGALVGVVEGIFDWIGAEEEDAESRKRARKEYEEKLRRWQEKRKIFKNSTRAAYDQWARKFRAARDSAEQKRVAQEEMEKSKTVNERRTMFANLVQGASNYKNRRQQELMSVWR